MNTYSSPEEAAGCDECSEPECAHKTRDVMACLQWRIEDLEQDLDAYKKRLIQQRHHIAGGVSAEQGLEARLAMVQAVAMKDPGTHLAAADCTYYEGWNDAMEVVRDAAGVLVGGKSKSGH